MWRARRRGGLANAAPNRAAKLAEEEWTGVGEEAANAAALALIRTLVPPDIKGDTVEGRGTARLGWWPRRRPRRAAAGAELRVILYAADHH